MDEEAQLSAWSEQTLWPRYAVADPNDGSLHVTSRGEVRARGPAQRFRHGRVDISIMPNLSPAVSAGLSELLTGRARPLVFTEARKTGRALQPRGATIDS